MPVSYSIESLRAMHAKAWCKFEKATIWMVVKMAEDRHVKLDSKLSIAVHTKKWDEVDRILRLFMKGGQTLEDTGVDQGFDVVAKRVAERADFKLEDLDGLAMRPRWKLHPEFMNLFAMAVALMLTAFFVVGLMGLAFSGSKTPPEAKTCLAQLEDVRVELKNVSARLKDVEDWRTSDDITRLAAEKTRKAMAVKAAKDIETKGNAALEVIQGKADALFKVVGDQVAAVQKKAEDSSEMMAKTEASAKTASALVASVSSTVATVSTTVTELNKSTKELKTDLVETRHNLMEYDHWYKGMFRHGAWFMFVVALACICLGYLGFQLGEVARDFTPVTASHDSLAALSRRQAQLANRVKTLEKLQKNLEWSVSAGPPARGPE